MLIGGATDSDVELYADERRDQINTVRQGGLVLPRVGWEVVLLFGLEPSSNELSYVDPIIPPPYQQD